jgi:glycosyltransferase involved in cell wall biosynthesis
VNNIHPVSILVPTHNEELNLEDCLRSVTSLSDDIWVVDSFSTDHSCEIAEEFGAKVVQHAYEGPAQQKNWALENINFSSEWVLIVDADERVSPELADEIKEIVSAGGNGYDGYYVNRRFMFYGKWIKHCGWYPSWNLRLFRHRLGRYEDREIHEHVILDGRVRYCKHDLIHEDLRDMTFWIEKHNRYSTHEAREINRLLHREKTTGVKVSFWNGGVERKRFIKEHIWPYVPGKAFVFFCYLYFFRLGFLDGRHGLHFCIMQGVFQEFNMMKLWELQHYKQSAPAGGISVRKTLELPTPVDIHKFEKS